ncbi:hypothetical protein U14_03376 [Candidatus Moduliflexus flocculans]|uniref:Uncharacterized protein n=1 Tax=Candidatus Moduliflexus flocculans TaxID=1499966 RepID=A0A081BP10_9BACT|nr:hypothetical protein U14_03376 [Candidatus Moduliflexus flocculans]
MMPLADDNIEQLIEAFSSDDLMNLSEDLLNIAIELTLQDDFDLSMTGSIAKSNDLLAIIPKIIASRLSKADLYSRKFLALDYEDLAFAGYSLEELRGIRKLLEDVIALFEKRSFSESHLLYRDVFEELKDSIEVDLELYRRALNNVNDAYKIQSRHVMNAAIDVYKRVNAMNFEHLLHEKLFVLEEQQRHLNNAIELLESKDFQDKYSEQLSGLRTTLIVVLEAISTQTINADVSKKRALSLDNILYHTRNNSEEYILRVLRRFAHISKDRKLSGYLLPEEIAARYKSSYIKHNRVLLSVISNPLHVRQADLLILTNEVLKNLSSALNVKLTFVETCRLCQEVLRESGETFEQTSPPEQRRQLLARIIDVLRILETYPTNSEYLETLQGKGYEAALVLLQSMQAAQSLAMANLLRQYQVYTARRLFALRISRLCMYISAHTPRQLSRLASERVLTLCRDLVRYKYDSLRPSSVYLEAMFDLDEYKDPVLMKLEKTLQILQGKIPIELDDSTAVVQERITLTPSFSQLVIDCFALKVQELDKVVEPLTSSYDMRPSELQAHIDSSRERIHYFLAQHQQENQLVVTTYEEDQETFTPA